MVEHRSFVTKELFSNADDNDVVVVKEYKVERTGVEYKSWREVIQ